MPVYRQTYRAYEEDTRHHFRWSIVTAQDFRVLLKFRFFYLILILAALHLFLRILQVMSYSIAMQDPSGLLAGLVRQMGILTVDDAFYFQFLRLQGLLALLTILFAGSGAICNDVRNNLVELLFAKPLSWKDYVLGKFMTLAGLGFLLFMVPVVLLMLVHGFMIPEWETFRESVSWILPSMAFSLLHIIPISLVTLAASALLPQQSYAGACVVALIVLNRVVHGMVSVLVYTDRAMSGYYAFSVSTSINHLGERLFNQPLEHELGLAHAVVSVLVVSVVAGVVYVWRVRRCEIMQ